MPFVLVILACLMVITYVPGLSLGCATWSTRGKSTPAQR
jgi:hypothetical protein